MSISTGKVASGVVEEVDDSLNKISFWVCFSSSASLFKFTRHSAMVSKIIINLNIYIWYEYNSEDIY